MTQVIEQNRNKLTELCRKYCVSRLDVFGSAVAGDFDEQTSDIDFLVEFDKSVKQNRFDNFFALHEELQKLFKRPVDLVEPGGLKNPYFIDSVNQTRKKIYAAS
ncbi:MAG: nucleotidyltransferase domain-containing protein [Sedimentisphaerales bacterium]